MISISSRWRAAAVVGMAMGLLLVGAAPADAYQPPGDVQLVSRSSEGDAPNAWSQESTISATGRYVVFRSAATNLVPNDTNGVQDVFLHDRATGVTELISVAHDGAQTNGPSVVPSVSSDGRYVAFTSYATNLVGEDQDGTEKNVYLRDRVARTTTVVAVADDGTPAIVDNERNPLTPDGRFIAFATLMPLIPKDMNSSWDVYVRDLVRGRTELVSLADDDTIANNSSGIAGISADGRYVSFTSIADNLVPDDTNGARNETAGWDIFVRDRVAGTTTRASVGDDGRQANDFSPVSAISGDGRTVAFVSAASNLVPADDNLHADLFIRDLAAGTTERASVSSHGRQGLAMLGTEFSLSHDGRFLAYDTPSALLVEDGPPDRVASLDRPSHIYVLDRLTRQVELVTADPSGNEDDGGGHEAAMSSDGRFVSFATTSNTILASGPGSCPQMTQDAACKAIAVRDRGPGLGIGRAQAERAPGAVTASGWARFDGSILTSATDPGDDADEHAADIGGEILGARILHRPELGDLLIEVELASLPGFRSDHGGWPLQDDEGFAWCEPCGGPSVAGAPGIRYSLRFHSAGTAFEVRASRALDADRPDAAPAFTLVRCATECEKVRDLAGSLGTTGPRVLVSLPLEALPSPALTEVSAATAVANGPAGTVAPLDGLTLPEATAGSPSVSVGVSSGEGEPHALHAASLTNGWYSAAIDQAGPGASEVWLRACVGERCATHRRPLP